MAVITTGNHPKALWPGVDAWWGISYNKHPVEYTDIFEVRDSSKNYEEQVENTGFGLAPVKAEGASTSYDSHQQGATTRYTNVAYGLGAIVTKEEIDDNQYEEIAMGRTESLAFSARTTREIVGANVLNRAFSSSYLGGDGKRLGATDHPTLDGTQQNVATTAADFSEASLEDMITLINTAKNTRGLQVALTGRRVIGPPALIFDMQRVLKSELRVGTADNDINAVRSMGLLPDGWAVNHYLTDADAWFVKTDAPRGLTWFDRKKLEFTKDNDFDTENAKMKFYMRFSCGWTDFRGMYCSPGA